MAKANSILKFRRRTEGKTDYLRRFGLLKSGLPRLVVRPSLRNVRIELVEYFPKGDKVVVSCDTNMLGDYGWKNVNCNTTTAYLTGLLCGKLVKDKVKKAILDVGRNNLNKGSVILAATKGFSDAGVEIPFSNDKVPSADRISGKHISDYANRIKKEDPKKYESYFSGYLSNGVKPEELPKLFEDTKKKILGK